MNAPLQLKNNSAQVESLRDQQRAYFNTQATRSLDFRIAMLERLRDAIGAYEKQLLEALANDLGKSEFEGFSNEIGLLYSEISATKKSLKHWMKVKRVKTDLPLKPAKAWIQPEPYGSVLVIAPWNYPIQLLLMPVIGAIAAGNTVVMKPSELAPACAQVLDDMVGEYFESNYIALMQGEADLTKALIKQNFDHIFFTGSTPVGKHIMAAASEFLTPVTLELGGKSPVIVDASANLSIAAKRIAFGKWNNAGQTCVAPDYVLVHQSVAEEFVQTFKRVSEAFYPDVANNGEYGRIISERHHQRLQSLLPPAEQIVFGGQFSDPERFFAPTISYPATWSDAAMQEEIFGPILPIIPFESLDEAIGNIRKLDKPLALYCFADNAEVQRRITEELSFGGGVINGSLMHVASHNLPFGGIGPSGMGSYHGKASFDCFSHQKSLLKQPTWFDPAFIYPNKRIATKWLRRVMR